MRYTLTALHALLQKKPISTHSAYIHLLTVTPSVLTFLVYCTENLKCFTPPIRQSPSLSVFRSHPIETFFSSHPSLPPPRDLTPTPPCPSGIWRWISHYLLAYLYLRRNSYPITFTVTNLSAKLELSTSFISWITSLDWMEQTNGVHSVDSAGHCDDHINTALGLLSYFAMHSSSRLLVSIFIYRYMQQPVWILTHASSPKWWQLAKDK